MPIIIASYLIDIELEYSNIIKPKSPFKPCSLHYHSGHLVSRLLFSLVLLLALHHHFVRQFPFDVMHLLNLFFD